MKKIVIKIIALLLIVLIVEIVFLLVRNDSQRESLQRDFDRKTRVQRLNNEKEKQALEEEYETRKYQATGNNVYERIFNKEKQSILELLYDLSKESFPDDWDIQLKVEEFTNFILLVQIGKNADQSNLNKIFKYIIPVLRHGSPYLSNVAIFDNKHKCYLFLDEKALKELKRRKSLRRSTIKKIKRQGKSFKRFNSIKIKCKKVNDHLYLPVQIYGDAGVKEDIMLLDTGASMSAISIENAMETGREDLNTVKRKTFITANGKMEAPIVTRRISIGGLDKLQEVAVNVNDKVNLLGVDFFKGKDYIIDATNEAIYIWNK